MKTVRLLKVVVQPIFVIDDGEVLDEATGAAITIPARDWPSFSQTAFDAQHCASLGEQIVPAVDLLGSGAAS